MKIAMRRNITAIGLAVLLSSFACVANAASVLTEKGYTLEKLLVFSRHNIRASLVGKDDVTATHSNRQWNMAEVPAGHLTYKGGAAETLMGEYYRAYLEDEKFIPADWHPAKNDVRFYANSFQRTIATAKHFASGLAPIADIEIEYHLGIDERDPVFLPSSKFTDEALLKQAAQWYGLLENGQGQKAFFKNRAQDLREIERIVDFKNSPFAKKEGVKQMDGSKFEITAHKNRIFSNDAMRKPYSLADCVIMRYYDNPNDKEVVWNISKPTRALKAAGKFLSDGGSLMWKNPAFAKNMTRNLLPEIAKGLKSNQSITFLCGHDTNVGTLLTVLEVEDHELPQTITNYVPIGSKLVIEKRKGADGKLYASFDMVYASDKQLRNLEILTLHNPHPNMRMYFWKYIFYSFYKYHEMIYYRFSQI